MKTLLALLLLASITQAHEGHDTPGVLPLAPHGGKLTEAEVQKGAHDDDELFFEVVYKRGKISLYPLLLNAKKDAKAFQKLDPKKDLADTSLTLHIPRKAGEKQLSFTVEGEGLISKPEVGRAHRFEVRITTEYKKRKRIAKLQLERR